MVIDMYMAVCCVTYKGVVVCDCTFEACMLFRIYIIWPLWLCLICDVLLCAYVLESVLCNSGCLLCFECLYLHV